MIYNLAQYLRTEFPAEIIYADVKSIITGQESVSDRIVILRDTGGTEQAWTRYTEATVQVVTRDTNNPGARQLAYDILEEITSRFGLILPPIIVGSTTYPAIETAQIKAIQRPYCLGADENGRIEYTTNYQIVLEA